MSHRAAFAITSTILVALCTARSAHADLTAAQRTKVETLLLHRVFPGPTADSGLACAWENSATCVPSSTHLSFAAALPAIPTLAACQGTGATVQTCYQAAVTRLQQALDGGDVLALFEAAYRTKDVIVRAKAAGSTAPAWLRVEGPSNLLWAFFANHGLPAAQLGSCRTGTDDARYTCLGALPRTIYRAALGALDEHNAILVRNQRVTGARNRALAIFRGATAPMTIAMVSRQAFDPTLGPGAQYVHELGRYFFLRAYEGLLGNAGPGGEVAHLDTLVGYRPSTLAVAPPAHLMVFAAHRGAGRWNPLTEKLQVLDAALDGDRLELIRLIEWTRLLGAVRNQPGVITKSEQLRQAIARTAVASNLDQLAAQGLTLPWDGALADSGMMHASTHGDPCGWTSLVDITRVERVLTVTTRTEVFVDQECVAACQASCALAPTTCMMQCTPQCAVTRDVTELHWGLVEVVVGQDLQMASIRDGYHDLMESKDTSPYDLDGDGRADLHYDDPDSATIANAGVRAGDANDGCLGELDELGSAYSTSFAVVGQGGDVDGDGASEGSLSSTFNTANQNFVPYPIAARICPDFTRWAVGLDGDGSRTLMIDALSSAAGAGHVLVPFRQTCETPWSYTRDVADFLGDPAMAAARAALAGDTGSDESVATTVADFANEALLLSVPVAGAAQQRADLAYVAGEVPNGSSAATWYAAHSGLDNLADKLDHAADPVGRGLDLAVAIGTAATGVEHAGGAEAMATESQAGFAICRTGHCADNEPDQVRALFFKRVLDALDLYQRNATTRFEVVQRRLDGELGATCLSARDADHDGIPDGLTCDTAAACAEVCSGVADATALVDGAAADLGGVRDMLTAQRAYLTDPTLTAYVTELAGFADAIALDLQRRRDAMFAGLDWLGERAGRWVPNITVDAETDLGVALANLDASSSSMQYERFIGDYLDRLAQIEHLATAEQAGATAASADLASQCADATGAPALGGCGLGSTWDATEQLVAQVNREIRDDLCDATLRLYYYDSTAHAMAVVTKTIDLSAPALADHVALMGSMGFVDGCPQVVSPSFDSLDTDTGTLAMQLGQVERQLLEVEASVAAIHTETAMMESNSRAAAALGQTLYTFADQQATVEKWVDGLLCAGAVVGSLCACGVITIATYGPGAATCVPAVGAAVTACAALANDDFFPNHISPEEVQIAFHEYSVSLQDNAELAALAADLERFIGATFDYGLAALSYRGAQADFTRSIAITDQTLGAMYHDAAFDPTAWFFQDQDFAAMKGRFQDFVRDVSEAHRLVEYATGHAIVEGSTLPLASGDYCLPRLADLTVFKTYGADFDSARYDLQASSCQASLAPERLNLVATASVLAELSDDFADVYGARAEADAWVIGSGAAVGGVDTDASGAVTRDDDLLSRAANPGEWALLHDSGFYDPLGYVDDDSDGDGVVCPAGKIDLHDVCDHFANGVTVHDDTCFAPATLTARARVDLAYLDHMVRGEGVSTFACTRTGPASNYTYGVAPATTTYFTFAALGGKPSWIAAATGSEVWFRDVPHGITRDYYRAQTATVRGVYARYFDAIASSALEADGTATLPATTLNRYPGTFVFRFDVSSPLGGEDATTPLFDVEQDLLTGAPGAGNTMAEQLVSMALVCADDYACADSSAHAVDLVLLGTGYQGDRYALTSGRQEQVAYAMAPWVMKGMTSWSARVLDLTSSVEVDAILGDPAVQAQFARRPLHTDGFFLAIAGAADANGNAYQDVLTGAATQWGLYRSSASSSASRIRLAARYSYYGTSAAGGAQAHDLVELLPCLSSSTSLISDTTKQCTNVAPY